MTTITEADVEQVALALLCDLSWQVAYGPDIAPDTPGAERDDYGQVVLEESAAGRPGQAQPVPAGSSVVLDDAVTQADPARRGRRLEARNRSLPPDAG